MSESTDMARLEGLALPADDLPAVPDDAVDDILERRAERLARVPTEVDETAFRDFLVVELARDVYGVEADAVQEVIPLRSLSRLPGAPEPLAGITTWHGDVLTVLDIRSVYGIDSDGLQDNRRVLVAGHGNAVFGILVDDVLELRRLSPTDIEEVPEGIAPGRDAVLGLGPDALLLLDVRSLVSKYSD